MLLGQIKTCPTYLHMNAEFVIKENSSKNFKFFVGLPILTCIVTFDANIPINVERDKA